ncbi:MAG: hypothetical protein KBD76_15305 [Bacteriovorax sp.]|nr:hypothetical protein [Bacteriovorax sp.]
MSLFKKTFLRTILLSLLTTATASEIMNYPAGIIYNKHSVLIVEEAGLLLDKDTTIHVDELILNGPIVTRGHSLIIDADTIRVAGTGMIIGFRNDQSDLLDVAQVGLKGFDSRYGGETGGVGFPGANGLPGDQAPKSIVVFAATTIGNLVINGNGQKGGTGGKGGQGGTGGAGLPGVDAKASCKLFTTSHPGGAGGTGGTGGQGGTGGTGGIGGRALEVEFFSGTSSNVNIISLPGEKGISGKPGDKGKGGNPGRGGRPASDSGFLCNDNQAGGATGVSGPDGEMGTTGKEGEYGPCANRQPLQQNFLDLELKRSASVKAWYKFHIQRMFYLLLEDSLRLQQKNLTRSDIGLAFISDELTDFFSDADKIAQEQIKFSWNQYLIEPLTLALQSNDSSFDKNEAEKILEKSKLLVGAIESGMIDVLQNSFKMAEYDLYVSAQKASHSCKNFCNWTA